MLVLQKTPSIRNCASFPRECCNALESQEPSARPQARVPRRADVRLDPIRRHEVRELIASLKEESKTVFFSTHILSDAEALCDRVAIVANGQLRGVGAVAELTASVRGKVEVIWEGSAAIPAIQALGGNPHVAGEMIRAVVDDSAVDRVIDALRINKARIISLTPVRTTLEDYFLSKLSQSSGETS